MRYVGYQIQMKSKKLNWTPLLAVLGLLSSSITIATPHSNSCQDLFLNPEVQKRTHSVSTPRQLTDEELVDHVSKKMGQVLEFEYIRNIAQELGIRVWLFGGTASSFLHYAKWDLATSQGLMSLQKERFDYDFTNIFRSTQDVDIVVDASQQVARDFQRTIMRRFPHFLGQKTTLWEVRTLKQRMGTPGFPGFKEALLDDPDFSGQNTDSNSVGMVEITDPPIGPTGKVEPRIRDLRNWDEKRSVFLEDALKNQITFYRSPVHFETLRAKNNENPEILSALRILVKAFQYDLKLSPQDMRQLKEISDQFNPRSITNHTAFRRIEDTAKKLIIHAVNIERAFNTLDDLGLRQKLITMGSKNFKETAAWWLNREPLRSITLGQGEGRTAKELGIHIVAHETSSFQAMESITRSHSGEPNVFISRSHTPDESASFGEGFYTLKGRDSIRGTGLTIRFHVDPNARENSDFTLIGNMVVFHNKKALKVIPESLSFGFEDILLLSETEHKLEVDRSDRGLLEKQKRRFNTARVLKELDGLIHSDSEEDIQLLGRILTALESPKTSVLIADEVRNAVIKNVFLEIQPLVQSTHEADTLRYIQLVGSMIKTLNEQNLLKTENFIEFLIKTVESQSTSDSLRQEALAELLLSGEALKVQFDLKKLLPPEMLYPLMNEVAQWEFSSNPRKRKFALELTSRWKESRRDGTLLDLLIPNME